VVACTPCWWCVVVELVLEVGDGASSSDGNVEATTRTALVCAKFTCIKWYQSITKQLKLRLGSALEGQMSYQLAFHYSR
jgi:hypothetical protein